MLRLIGFIVVLGAATLLVYRYVVTPPEARACERLVSLCGEKAASIAECVDDVRELRQSSSDAAAKLETCVAGANSCGEGAGCLVGVGIGAASNMLSDFVKGVGKALDKK